MNTYTHGHAEAVLRSHRWRTAANSAAYLLPHLDDGQRLLDVGSGPGTITADLAREVREVVALEVTEEAAALTRAELDRQGVTNATVVVGDVHALDLELLGGEPFDVVHAHQVLQHLTEPVAALREMRRVARPGGIVAVRDADFHGMSWYPSIPELDEWMELYQRIARRNGAEPDAGRRLVSWAQAAGFTDVAPTSSNWLYATGQQRRWQARVWGERVLHSAFADQALEYGFATPAELARISAGWHRWGSTDDGWFLIPNGEVIARA